MKYSTIRGVQVDDGGQVKLAVGGDDLDHVTAPGHIRRRRGEHPLFGALPPILASRILYGVLATIGPEPGRTRASRIRNAQEELLVRASMPFPTQILDLNVGGEWRLHRAIVRQARSLGDEEAAERAAKSLIESDLIYPRMFLPSLLTARSDTPAPPDDRGDRLWRCGRRD